MDADETLAVAGRLYEYARCIDGEDWDGFSALFTDQVHLDYTSFDPNRTAGPVPREEWIARLRPRFAGLASSQHVMTNPIVQFGDDGTSAEISMYLQAHHVGRDVVDGEPERFTIGGRYTDGLRKVDGVWLIDRVELEVFWRTGSRRLMERFFETPAG